MALRGILPLAFVSCPPASTSRIIDSRAIFDIMETIMVLLPEGGRDRLTLQSAY